MEIFKEKIGNTGIKLPIIKFGSGRPKVLILACQHGSEHSPLKIVKEILEKKGEIKGQITILPVANPLGLEKNMRNEPISNQNLNRSFPGNASGNVADQIAYFIFQLSLKQDLVIDLHAFSQRQSPFMTGYECNDQKVKEKIKKVIQCLRPDLVWQVNPENEEDKRFKGSLDGQLSLKGIPSVFLEMPNLHLIEKKMIERITEGIIKAVNNFGKEVEEMEIKQYNSQTLYSERLGLFEAKVKILTEVKKGEIIGEMTNVENFNKTKIVSPADSTVLTVLEKGTVKEGDKLASLGTNQTVL